MDNKNNKRVIDEIESNLVAYQKSLKEISCKSSDYMVGLQNVITEVSAPLVKMQESIVAALKPIKEFGKVLLPLNKLGKNQFVYWEYISKELSMDIIRIEDINAYMYDYYTTGTSPYVKKVIINCERTARMKPYTKLFFESIVAYNSEHYNLAIIGLLAIADGLLSDISEDPDFKITKRARIILDRLSNEGPLVPDDISELTLYVTFTDMYNSISKHAPFNGEEPELLNRHWLMHGRSRKTISNIDCIKIINYIYGILLLDSLNE